jgi:hypothetical protein
MAETVNNQTTKEAVPDLETIMAKAKRAFALKHWEQAVALYGDALEHQYVQSFALQIVFL